MHKLYLALGSNLGNRRGNLQAALDALGPQILWKRSSPIYETPPWGYTEQPAFLNMVVAAETDLEPLELLQALKGVEARVGRTPSFRYGPRQIDLDILFYDDLILDTPELVIPHPRLVERAFVLQPLVDLNPGLSHPGLGRTAASLLADVDVTGMKLFDPPRRLAWGRQTYVMGIINVTPDSFSGDGLLGAAAVVEAAVEQARRFVAAGADILDIGGESTRPGSEPVDADEEMGRILPVIRALTTAGLGTIISVDTYKAETAEAALRAGAHWINDVWGLQADPRLAEVAARRGASVVLMHNRSTPQQVEIQQQLGGRYVGTTYTDLVAEVCGQLQESAALARAAGVPAEQIILDPGIGFGKTVEQNLELVNRLNDIRALGYPVLLGVSRKGFIGYTLNQPPEQRLQGTAAAVAVGIARGADIVRVHDVEAMVQVARMTDAITRR
ncbi:MAG TPA: dihydropteroate synthase [Anaerolineaceae bacterium]|jgi:dihydropteroate synthase/2-amino-4-hydroxy-6-hydroxymethyldihydropteridine diphosphokinase|nr:dihydropteroate synthase [Anaerolineaceae bacterium]